MGRGYERNGRPLTVDRDAQYTISAMVDPLWVAQAFQEFDNARCLRQERNIEETAPIVQWYSLRLFIIGTINYSPH